MPLEFRERHHRKRLLVRRREHHRRRDAGVERLLPASRAQAPLIAGPEPRKSGGRDRSGEVVAVLPREFQEFARHPDADHMDAGIVVAGVAAAVAVEAGQWIEAAGRERLAEHVQRLIGLAALFHPAIFFSMRRAKTVISFSACLSPFLCAAAMPLR